MLAGWWDVPHLVALMHHAAQRWWLVGGAAHRAHHFSPVSCLVILNLSLGRFSCHLNLQAVPLPWAAMWLPCSSTCTEDPIPALPCELQVWGRQEWGREAQHQQGLGVVGGVGVSPQPLCFLLLTRGP